MLGDEETDLGEVEDLAGLDVNHLGVPEPGPTRGARRGCVNDRDVGVCHLGQMLAGGTGLFALLPRGGTTLRTRRGGRFREQLRGGGRRGAPGVAAETLLQIGNLALQAGDLSGLRLHKGGQLLVCRRLRGGIAGRNSPRYARRWRRWWTRGQEA